MSSKIRRLGYFLACGAIALSYGSAAFAAPVQGKASVKLTHVFATLQTGQEDKKPEDIEESSKMERSRLDYRNVKSDLSPAQKDLLNQDRIPWEYRPLIKDYFQAIRPTAKKQDKQ